MWPQLLQDNENDNRRVKVPKLDNILQNITKILEKYKQIALIY